jgi:hypothetical protein
LYRIRYEGGNENELTDTAGSDSNHDLRDERNNEYKRNDISSTDGTKRELISDGDISRVSENSGNSSSVIARADSNQYASKKHLFRAPIITLSNIRELFQSWFDDVKYKFKRALDEIDIHVSDYFKKVKYGLKKWQARKDAEKTVIP